jgi:hypothetical protein
MKLLMELLEEFDTLLELLLQENLILSKKQISQFCYLTNQSKEKLKLFL